MTLRCLILALVALGFGLLISPVLLLQLSWATPDRVTVLLNVFLSTCASGLALCVIARNLTWKEFASASVLVFCGIALSWTVWMIKSHPAWFLADMMKDGMTGVVLGTCVSVYFGRRVFPRITFSADASTKDVRPLPPSPLSEFLESRFGFIAIVIAAGIVALAVMRIFFGV